MHFSVEKIDEILHVSVFHNVVVFVLTGTTKRQHLQAMARVMEDALAAYPRGIVVSSLLAEGATAPALELRNEVSALGERYASRVLLGIPIIEDAGIFAAARRAFMRGVLLLMRRSKVVVASSLEDAAKRIAVFAMQADGTAVTQTELLALLRYCRRHLDEA